MTQVNLATEPYLKSTRKMFNPRCEYCLSGLLGERGEYSGVKRIREVIADEYDRV